MLMTATRTASKTGRPLEGRIAIVTGSTSGIGLGVARSLASNGAAVLLNGLGDRVEIDALVSSLSTDYGVDVAYGGADLSDPAQIEQLVDEAAKRFGQVDILVNNAGVQHVAPVGEFPAEKWNLVIAVNLSAAFHLTRLIFPAMKERGWGRIINMSSAHGLIASPFKAAYVASKHGIIGLTKVVALEGAEFGITCNAICPGYVWTPLVEKQIDDQAKSHGISREEVVRDVLLAKQPSKRFGTVEELGALAAFLCSDGGASITGASIPVDGGWTAQ